MLDGSEVFACSRIALRVRPEKRRPHSFFLPKVRELTFLRNHRKAIAAMDFFAVPTLTFEGSALLFRHVAHDRRKILHCNVTRERHALWVGQQLREAWAYKQPHRFLLFDRDAKFGADVISVVKNIGSPPTRTAFRSPWHKRGGGALGGKLPPRLAGPRDHPE